MSLDASRFALVLCVAAASACAVVGCLGGDDTSVPGAGSDGGLTGDARVAIFDANGQVDGQPAPPTPDAGIDAEIPDAGADSFVPPVRDAGIDSGAVTITGLVAGGTTSKSASYSLTATAGPATGVVAQSKNYQLVGGMAVSTQPVK